MNEFLFTYGTLQKEEVQLKLFGRRLKGSSDTLEDYTLFPFEVEDREFLARGEDKLQKTLLPTGICGDFVEGTVFEITEDELLIVDDYEPKSFIRMKVVLKSGKKAWIYIAK